LDGRDDTGGPLAPGDEEPITDFGIDSDFVSAPTSIAPGMIGDFFGGVMNSYSSATVGIGGGDRRFKIGENNSPAPRDRFFFNYHWFQNALGPNGDVSLHRYVFGLEKTFFSELTSVEVRVPFATGLDSRQNAGIAGPEQNTEFGDVSLALKGILRETDGRLLSAGLGMTFPTADDGTFVNGAYQLNVENEAFHLQPFIGYLSTPTDRLFMQSFLQLDFDMSGYTMTDNAGGYGVLQDQHLLYMDFSGGYWLYENPYASFVSAVAGMVELHYTTTLNDADTVLNMGHGFNRMDVLNITGGFHIEVGQRSSLRIACAAP